MLEEEEKRQEEKKLREAEEQARKVRLVGKSNYKLQAVDPFDLFQVRPVKARGWDQGKTLSPKMRGFLQRFGFDPDKFDFAKAGQLIGTLKDRLDKKLCTPKQALWLKNHGYSPDLPMTEASTVMNAWSSNGWKRPWDLRWRSSNYLRWLDGGYLLLQLPDLLVYGIEGFSYVPPLGVQGGANGIQCTDEDVSGH